ncbi:MAG: hypothetical protein ACE37E_01135 [Hyphomicrobiales bacterium]
MNRSQALSALSKNFATLPTDDPQAIAMGFSVALEGLPDWAVIAAVQAFLRYEVDGQSEKYRPPAPFVAKEAKRIVRQELARQNQPIFDEQQRLKAAGVTGWFKYGKTRLIDAEAMRPGADPVATPRRVIPLSPATQKEAS